MGHIIWSKDDFAVGLCTEQSGNAIGTGPVVWKNGLFRYYKNIFNLAGDCRVEQKWRGRRIDGRWWRNATHLFSIVGLK